MATDNQLTAAAAAAANANYLIDFYKAHDMPIGPDGISRFYVDLMIPMMRFCVRDEWEEAARYWVRPNTYQAAKKKCDGYNRDAIRAGQGGAL